MAKDDTGVMTNKKGLPHTKTKGVNVRAGKEYLNRANPSKSTSNAIMQWKSMDKKSRMEKVFGGKLSDERYKQINRLLNAKQKQVITPIKIQNLLLKLWQVTYVMIRVQ